MLRLAIVFLVVAFIAAFLDSPEWRPCSGKGRRYCSLSSSFSPCCLSWGMASGGGTTEDNGSATDASGFTFRLDTHNLKEGESIVNNKSCRSTAVERFQANSCSVGRS